MRPQLGSRKSAKVELPTDGTPAWAKLPGETYAAREAFEEFLADPAGPGRTIEAFARRTDRKLGSCLSWSARFRWIDRALSFDQHNLSRVAAKLQARALAVAEENEQVWADLLPDAAAHAKTELTNTTGRDAISALDTIAKGRERAVGLGGTGRGPGGTGGVQVNVQVNTGPSAEQQLDVIMRALQSMPEARNLVQLQLAREFDPR